ncbi:expressed unknown protein [Seminavis robusta]|uniref:Uncharacterized protein n=1 Tax=Seminavis robusta TaxID=568900 RepID=A0A9N8D7Z4_9STRA|nr:expressed unknown protein [Seminavis robusta]|eukprot:Sro30_g019650.1 n/a (533) ;mRNA; f:84604-86419
MSPEAEQQHSDEELELVSYRQHQAQQALSTPPTRRARHRHNRRGNHHRRHQAAHVRENGDYHDDDEDEEDLEEPFEDEDDEDEYTSGEDEGLISQISVDRTALFGNHHNGNGSSGNTVDDYFYYGFSNAEAAIDWRCAFWLVISFLLAAFMAVVLPSFNNSGNPIVQDDGTVIFPNGTKTSISVVVNPPSSPTTPGSTGTVDPNNNNPNNNRNSTSHAVALECPNLVQNAENFHNTSVEESYINRTSQIDSNFSGFLATYHESEFDGWGKPYDFVKAGMYHWKSTRFPKNLKDGDSIYESACGIGLNLIMTLEILQEVKGVNNLMVYGNEYIPSSANASNRILDSLLPNLNATKGSVCAADSTNLQFIPSNSFDLVFTGYISTLLDPLGIEKGVKENYQYYESICEGESWQDQKLKEVAQQRQNDWFGTWVSEMVRIAKPGAPVIVEQVSYPFCDAYFDWGGVNQEFWTDYAIPKYGWEVDPASIEFEDDRLFRKRYHVFMRKHAVNVTKVQVPPPVIGEPNNNGGGGRGGG